jgi:DNA-binding transcriptional ArsR family regulator
MPLEKTLDVRLRALSHPLRLRILGMVTARAVSATEVAAATGVAHAAASYHLRQLATAGLIRAVDEPDRNRSPGRGRPHQRYAMRREALRGLGPRSVRLLDRRFLSELERKLGHAGTKRMTDAEAWLRPADWRKLRALVEEAGKIVHSRALRPGAPRSKHVSLTSVLLEFAK